MIYVLCMENFFINGLQKKVKQFYVRVGDAGAKSKSVLFKSVYNKFHIRMGDIKCRLENTVIWHLVQLTV